MQDLLSPHYTYLSQFFYSFLTNSHSPLITCRTISLSLLKTLTNPCIHSEFSGKWLCKISESLRLFPVKQKYCILSIKVMIEHSRSSLHATPALRWGAASWYKIHDESNCLSVRLAFQLLPSLLLLNESHPHFCRNSSSLADRLSHTSYQQNALLRNLRMKATQYFRIATWFPIVSRCNKKCAIPKASCKFIEKEYRYRFILPRQYGYHKVKNFLKTTILHLPKNTQNDMS